MYATGRVLLCFVIFMCFCSPLQAKLKGTSSTRSLQDRTSQATSLSSWMSPVNLNSSLPKTPSSSISISSNSNPLNLTSTSSKPIPSKSTPTLFSTISTSWSIRSTSSKPTPTLFSTISTSWSITSTSIATTTICCHHTSTAIVGDLAAGAIAALFLGIDGGGTVIAECAPGSVKRYAGGYLKRNCKPVALTIAEGALVALVEGKDGEPQESSVSRETPSSAPPSTPSSAPSSAPSSSSSQCITKTGYDYWVECIATASGGGEDCVTTSTSKTIGCSPTTTIATTTLAACGYISPRDVEEQGEDGGCPSDVNCNAPYCVGTVAPPTSGTGPGAPVNATCQKFLKGCHCTATAVTPGFCSNYITFCGLPNCNGLLKNGQWNCTGQFLGCPCTPASSGGSSNSLSTVDTVAASTSSPTSTPAQSLSSSSTSLSTSSGSSTATSSSSPSTTSAIVAVSRTAGDSNPRPTDTFPIGTHAQSPIVALPPTNGSSFLFPCLFSDVQEAEYNVTISIIQYNYAQNKGQCLQYDIVRNCYDGYYTVYLGFTSDSTFQTVPISIGGPDGITIFTFDMPCGVPANETYIAAVKG